MNSASYAKTHNRLVRRYQRYSLYIFWAAAFSIVALIVCCPTTNYDSYKYALDNSTTVSRDGLIGVGFGAMLNIPGTILSIYFKYAPSENIKTYFIVFASFLAVIFSAGMLVIALFARKGKKWAQLTAFIFYAVDLLCIFFYIAPFSANFLTVSDYYIDVVLHIVILVFIILAYLTRLQLVKLKKDQDDLIAKDREVSKDKYTIVSFKTNKSKKDGVDFISTDKTESDNES